MYTFVMLDGKEGDNVQDVDIDCCTTLIDCCTTLRTRFVCRRCKYKFGELTGTYLAEFYISLDILVHLIYLYALGVPAYRIRFYLSISLATIERTFRIFRQSIYNESLQKLKELK